MDAQLRQRLIGAAVLIALAVIFLPMLLSGRREVGSQEVSLEIPPEGAPTPGTADERTVTLPADRTPAPLPVTPSPSEPDVVTTIDTSTAPPPDSAPSTPAPIPREPEPVATSSTPAVAATPPPVRPPPAPTAATAVNQGGPFHLRLGSYSQAERAQALVAELAKLGIAADAQPLQSNGKTLYRVQSAGFPNRTAAESARLKAVGAISGLTASIGESAVATPTAPTRTPAAGAIAWAVQLGVFGVEAKANELMDKAKRAGLPAYVERITTANGPALRVRVGPAPQEAQAKALRDQVKTKLGLDGIIVSHP